MVIDDIVVNKCSAVEQTLARIHEEYMGRAENLENQTKLDSIILNLQRACESSIDLAMHLVRAKKLGTPQRSREAFELLAAKGIIPESLSLNLQKMVGFRNIAIHQYQKLDLAIVQSIIEENLGDFKSFIESVKGM